MVPSLVVEHTIFLAEVDTGDLMYFALQTIEVVASWVVLHVSS